MAKGRIFEKPLSQANHNANDAISYGKNVRSITVKNMLTGSGNISVGWGSPGGGNILIPGESKTYQADNIEFDDKENLLYIKFLGAGSGQALVSSISEVC